ncbi:MAG: hypothetical protein VKJ02_11660 [Snowella sp.]|nr:hypothetical protein [Snowella sp.]
MKSPVISSPSSAIAYPAPTLQRAKVALKASAFCLPLFTAMREKSIPLPMIANYNGLNAGYTEKILSERRVEADLMWLIQVGLLRREVDGQGITDSFRLTPMGKYLINQWEQQGPTWTKLNLKDRLFNRLQRWLSQYFKLFSI